MRQRVLDMGRDWQHVGQELVVQGKEHVDRGLIALHDRGRRIARHHALLAQVLQQHEPVVQIGLVDLGRGEAALAQTLRHRHERRDGLGEMGDRAIGAPLAHRWAVGAARRVHQDHALVAHGEPVVAPGRGVALHAGAQRVAVAALGNELAHRRDPVHPRCKGAVAGDPRMAEFGLELGDQRERDIEPIRRQQTFGTVGPLQ